MTREPDSGCDDATDHECMVCRTTDAHAGETIAHVANRIAGQHPDADICLVLGDPRLPDGWLEHLRGAAAGESTTATVSALPDTEPLDDTDTGDETQHSHSALLSGDGIISPRASLVSGPCVYVSRAAFDLLGGMDETLPTSSCVVAGFGLRARQLGLANLLAGDLVVSTLDGARLNDADEAELAQRFPELWLAAKAPLSAAAERSIAVARTALRKLTVTIDARSLGAETGGTQIYVLELIRFLAATDELRIRVLVGPDSAAATELEGLDETSIITYEQALTVTTQTDLVHRPQQVFTVDDLDLLRPLGRRLVITHLDLIAYHNPTYFPELAHWERHVRTTRTALAVADHVLFLSGHALRDAQREDLIDPARASVVALGAEPSAPLAPPTRRPQALAGCNEPYLFCLGADYTHKNRPFALELVDELRRVHSWRGMLVFAGTHVAHGSSAASEQRLLEQRPDLRGAVVDLGPVSDSERRWLLSHARALVYPTVVEGFGLVPFEAAEAGVPCLFAAQSSLAELLPPELATLDGWDLERAGELAAPLLDDQAARKRHVDALQSACRRYRWELCAAQTLDAYRRTLRSQAQSSTREAWEALEREKEIVRLDQSVHDLVARIEALTSSLGADAMSLVGPTGLLSRQDQRALLALVARPALRRPLIGFVRAGYSLARGRRAQG